MAHQAQLLMDDANSGILCGARAVKLYRLAIHFNGAPTNWNVWPWRWIGWNIIVALATRIRTRSPSPTVIGVVSGKLRPSMPWV